MKNKIRLYSLFIVSTIAVGLQPASSFSLSNELLGYPAEAQQENPSSNVTGGNTGQPPEPIKNMVSSSEGEATINLTRQKLNPVLNYLFDARAGLLQNNFSSAFDALSSAATQVFKIKDAQSGDKGEVLTNLDPLQRQIELARSSLMDDKNQTTTLRHINAADTIYIQLSQNIP
jgi:hypothetical protein